MKVEEARIAYKIETLLLENEIRLAEGKETCVASDMLALVRTIKDDELKQFAIQRTFEEMGRQYKEPGFLVAFVAVRNLADDLGVQL